MMDVLPVVLGVLFVTAIIRDVRTAVNGKESRMNKRESTRRLDGRRSVAIILGVLLVGLTARILPVTSAPSSRFDCIVHRAGANGDPDWTRAGVIRTSRQQSLYGCEGWLYAMAIRARHIVYGRWGLGYFDANENGRIAEWNANRREWVQRIPNYMEDLINGQVGSLNNFWATQFVGTQMSYSRPSVKRILGPSVACANRVTRTDSFYCQLDQTIYIGQGLLEVVLTQGGNFPPVVVLAHEWGHHIQWLLHILDTYNQKNVEIQADCFAGVYAIDEERRGMLDVGDADAAAKLMFAIGDGPDSNKLSPWFNTTAHGSGEERLQAFIVGVKEGIGGCRKLR
jgi:predicted metalloprotease